MDLLRKLFDFPPVPIACVSVLCFIAILGLRGSGFLEHLELSVYDWFVRSRPTQIQDQSRILIIEISEEDILVQGRWPLTDATLSKALKLLLIHHPRAIGLDIFRDISVPPGSWELDLVLSSNPNIICVTKFGNDGVPPPSILAGTDQAGFNDMLVDSGGIIRRGLLFLDNGKQVFYAFNLLLALIFLQKEGITAGPDDTNPDHFKLGQTTIKPLEPSDGGYINADARGYQYLIDYRDTADFYQSRSLTRLLSGKISSQDIQDKIVLVGVVAQSVKDHFYTPFSRGFQADQKMPGVVVHGRLTSQLIRFGLNEASPIKTLTENQEIGLMLLWSLLGGIAGFFIRSVWHFSILMAAALSLVSFSAHAAFLNGWWVPLVPMALTGLLSTGMITAYVSDRENKQKAILMQLFSKLVAPKIAKSIWENRNQFLLNGRPRPQKMTATILFSDIRGFTSICETLEPQVLIQWLNTYMAAMTRTIMAHGGVVDDYAGDGIKANFGIPLPRTNEADIGRDAQNAVNCAIKMGEEMERLNALWQYRGLPQSGTRIGIFTGSIVAGALGSSTRMKYTTVGNIVNIAARLESYDKDLGRNCPWRILIGETTLKYLDGQFNTQLIVQASLEGKNERLNIYRVLSKR